MNKVRMRLKEKPLSDKVPAEVKQYIDDALREDRKKITKLEEANAVLRQNVQRLTERVASLNSTVANIRAEALRQTTPAPSTRIDAGVVESLRTMGVDTGLFSREVDRHADRYGLHDVRVYVEDRLLDGEMRVVFRWREGDWQQLTWTQIVPIAAIGRNTPRDESLQARLLDGLLGEWRRLYGNPTPAMNIRITDHT